jgi:hypothetical protein
MLKGQAQNLGNLVGCSGNRTGRLAIVWARMEGQIGIG